MARNETFETRLQKYQQIANQEGYTLLTNTQFNVKKDRVQLRCPNGHEYDVIWSHFATSGRRCRQCFYNNQRLSNEEVQEKMPSGYLLLEPWKNPQQKYKIRCNQGHEYVSIGQNIIDGKGCGICDQENRSKQWKAKLPDVLPPDVTVVQAEKSKELILRCKQGHTYKATFSNLPLQKHPCPQCFKAANEYSEEEVLAEANKRGYKIVQFKPLSLKCDKGHIYPTDRTTFMSGHGCLSCSKSQSSSKPEREIRDYIISLGFEVVNNESIPGSPYEADIRIDEKKLMIEYCGLYWHCERTKPNNYHRTKYEAANRAGYRLIQIFEDEYLEKPEIVRSIIGAKLGKSTISIGARECDIIPASFQELRSFYEKNHIQGAGGAGQSTALVYHGKVIAAMTIAQHHRKPGQHQLSRYCIHQGYQILGSAEKLWKNLIETNQFEEIITFADLRWHTGNIYSRLGFVLDGEVAPDYSYLLPGRQKRAPKQQFKHTKNERQSMFDLEHWRIYDAGKLRFKWKRPTC